MIAGRMLQHDKQTSRYPLQYGIPHCALRIPHSAFVPSTVPPPGDFTLGAPGWSAVDRTIRDCGMRNAECGMFLQIEALGDLDRTDNYARVMLQHDKQTSRYPLQYGIPHCDFRIPHSAFVPSTGPRPGGSTLGVPGWLAVDRTIRECGMRSAECGMLFADRGAGRFRQDR